MRTAVRATVIIPCYNEERRLDVEAFRNFSLAGVDLQFCFVNDGSTDGTLAVIEGLAREDSTRFRAVNLAKNGGKAEAVRQGILAAAADQPEFLGFWDADLATPLEEMKDFFDVFRIRPDVDLIFASRVRLLGRDIRRQAARHYFGRVGATLISLTLGIPVYDTQCGAKLFRYSPEIVSVFDRPFISRWIFDVEIIARLIERRGRQRTAGAIYELPLRVWKDVRGSKVQSSDFAKALRDLWKIKRAYKLR